MSLSATRLQTLVSLFHPTNSTPTPQLDPIWKYCRNLAHRTKTDGRWWNLVNPMNSMNATFLLIQTRLCTIVRFQNLPTQILSRRVTLSCPISTWALPRLSIRPQHCPIVTTNSLNTIRLIVTPLISAMRTDFLSLVDLRLNPSQCRLVKPLLLSVHQVRKALLAPLVVKAPEEVSSPLRGLTK